MPRPRQSRHQISAEKYRDFVIDFERDNIQISVHQTPVALENMHDTSFIGQHIHDLGSHMMTKYIYTYCDGYYFAELNPPESQEDPWTITIVTAKDFEEQLKEERDPIKMPVEVDRRQRYLTDPFRFLNESYFVYGYEEDVAPDYPLVFVLSDVQQNHHKYTNYSSVKVRDSNCVTFIRNHVNENSPIYAIVFDGTLFPNAEDHLREIIFDDAWDLHNYNAVECSNLKVVLFWKRDEEEKLEKLHAVDVEGNTMNLLTKYPQLSELENFDTSRLFIHIFTDDEFCFTFTNRNFATTVHMYDGVMKKTTGMLDLFNSHVKHDISLLEPCFNNPVTEYYGTDPSHSNTMKYRVIDSKYELFHTDCFNVSNVLPGVSRIECDNYFVYFFLSEKRIVFVHHNRKQKIESMIRMDTDTPQILYREGQVVKLVQYNRDISQYDVLFSHENLEVRHMKAWYVISVVYEDGEAKIHLNNTCILTLNAEEEYMKSCKAEEGFVFIHTSERSILFILDESFRVINKHGYGTPIKGKPSIKICDGKYLYLAETDVNFRENLLSLNITVIDVVTGMKYHKDGCLVGEMIDNKYGMRDWVSDRTFVTLPLNGVVECCFNEDTKEISTFYYEISAELPLIGESWSRKFGYLEELTYKPETKGMLWKKWLIDLHVENYVEISEDHYLVADFFAEASIEHILLPDVSETDILSTI
ncbi:hypothetical protein PCE1_000576 [Barthelona sp. PCE]